MTQLDELYEELSKGLSYSTDEERERMKVVMWRILDFKGTFHSVETFGIGTFQPKPEGGTECLVCGMTAGPNETITHDKYCKPRHVDCDC